MPSETKVSFADSERARVYAVFVERLRERESERI